MESVRVDGDALSASYRTRLHWLNEHRSPDEEFNRRLAAYLDLPPRINALVSEFGEADQEQQVRMMQEILSDIREAVGQLQSRAVELLRGK